MGLPKKALRESQLKLEAVCNDGSHVEMFRVTFIEDGIQKSAFFKKLEPNYPELLAKISVAISEIKRSFQGKRSASERLVFDNDDKLIGTLSIIIDGFKSFQYASESVPSESSAKEQTIPSTKTLIEKKAIATYLGRWFLDDDDGHPHNVGFAGSESVDIDFDMFLYWFTIYMKAARPIIGVPKKRVDLSVRDWETFPIVKDSKPYHWPTFKHPGQESLPVLMPVVQGQLLNKVLPKIYGDPTQFEQLAREPEAQEQKFAETLKILLTYQPDVMRKRLVELFGDLTLNYTSLDDTLRVKYEEEFPEICNVETNVMSFVDFMMNIYQKHYDNLYRVAVFYMGCENNGYGIALPSTCSALYYKPSFYKDIVEWVKVQNETFYSKENSLKIDLIDLQKRYHQIWRDAYAPTVRDLLHSSYNLTNKLLQQVSSSHLENAEIVGKKITDESFTQAWELFGTMPKLSIEEIEPLINVDKESKLREALLLLIEFTSKFHDTVQTYYGKERKDLLEEDNLEFSEKINQLYANYNLRVRQSLAHTSTHASEFNLIASKLKQVTEQANFQLHLITTDDQIHDAIKSTVDKKVLPHDDPLVIKQFNDSLFLWAKSLRPEELSQYINEIIDTKYAPVFKSLSTRRRAQPVKDFLLASMNHSGDNRLAYILASGNEDTGALNTLLVQHLTPLMLQTYALPSIHCAIRDGNFERDIPLFTKSAVGFAKYERRFMHLANPEGIKLFYETMFDWLDKLETSKFNGIVKSSLTEYEQTLWFSSRSRRGELEQYCKSNGQAKAIALAFVKGDNTSTLNGTLFQKIIEQMKLDISKSPEKQELPGNKLILQYNAVEHAAVYEAIKIHSAGPSHKQEAKSSAAMSL